MNGWELKNISQMTSGLCQTKVAPGQMPIPKHPFASYHCDMPDREHHHSHPGAPCDSIPFQPFTINTMKFFKSITVLALFVGFAYTVQAQSSCTVTTPCNTYTFNDVNGVSTSSQTVNGNRVITISDNNGNVLATETCNQPGGVSSSCSSSGGNNGGFDICDFLTNAPAWLRERYGCN